MRQLRSRLHWSRGGRRNRCPCEACGHAWTREPKLVCSRCGSEDIEIGAYEGWAYDDIEEAREAPEGGTWAYVDREVFRCRKCNWKWRRSGAPCLYKPS